LRREDSFDVCTKFFDVLPTRLEPRVPCLRIASCRLDSSQTLRQRFKLGPTLGQLGHVRRELPHSLTKRFRLPVKGAHNLLPADQRVELSFCGAEGALQVRNALLVSVEALSLDEEPVELSLHRLNQVCAILFDPRRLPRKLIASFRRRLELALGFFRESLRLSQNFLCGGDLTTSFLELPNLHFHRPDHLVQPAGLSGGMLNRQSLRVECLRFDAHVLG
jgi:hypothetical protein